MGVDSDLGGEAQPVTGTRPSGGRPSDRDSWWWDNEWGEFMAWWRATLSEPQMSICGGVHWSVRRGLLKILSVNMIE